MKLRLSPRARDDLAEIGRYIRARNPVAAIGVRDAIRSSLSMLTRYPRAGKAVGDEGVRRLLVPRLPYLIFYCLDEPAGTVDVITIRHAARQEED